MNQSTRDLAEKIFVSMATLMDSQSADIIAKKAFELAEAFEAYSKTRFA